MRFRPLISRLAIVVGATLVSLLIAEVAFRAYEARFLVRELPAQAESYDLASLGYNDGTIAAARQDGEFRILSLGDSFTWSVVRFPHSWNGVLQRELRREVPGRPARVVNLGVGDCTFDVYVRQYRFWSSRLEHDAAIFQVYVGNDFVDVRGARSIHRKMYGDPSDANLERVRIVAEQGEPLLTGPGVGVPRRFGSRMLDYSWALFWSWKLGGGGAPEYLDTLQVPWERYVPAMSVAIHPYRTTDSSRNEVVEGYAAALDLLAEADAVEKAGRRAVVLLSPPALFFQARTRDALTEMGVEIAALRPDLPARVFARLAAVHGLEVRILDLLPCLLERPDAADLYYGTNTHWGLEGNRTVGEMLAGQLAADWLGSTASTSPMDCELEVTPEPAPDEETERYLARVVQAVEKMVDETPLVDALLAETYATRTPLHARFERQGLRPGGEEVQGFNESVAAREAGAEEPPSHARGWFSAGAADSGPALVLAFHAGRLVGWGRATQPRPDVVNALGLDGGEERPLQYRVPLAVSCEALAADDSLWLYGVADTGEFGPIYLGSGPGCG